MSPAPLRPVPLSSDDVVADRRGDGTMMLRSPEALAPYGPNLTERFAHWARTTPDRTFIAQRGDDGPWRRLSYAETYQRFCAIGASLLERGLSAERPIAILSDNDIEHQLLALAAMHVGIPYVPISAAYSLVSTDHTKLRYIFGLLTPGLVFAADGERYARAIAAAVPPDVEVVVTQHPAPLPRCTRFAELERGAEAAAVEQAHAAVTPDTIAKFLLTSGSTGSPKAVINTQRMLCSNQQMIAQALPMLHAEPPVLLDWLPWNHTFGGNHNTGIVIWHGGTLHIDDGKPTPALFGRTVRNLREIAPTAYFNVPRGFEELVRAMRVEPALRDHFFSRVGVLMYAGAALAQPVWDAMDELATEACGHRILWVTGLGATETSPSVTFTRGDGVKAGMIGVPVPGVEVKIAPVNEKLEMRVKGPSVTPGYWRQADLTRNAFDDEGYYRLGDAVGFVDPQDLRKGLYFDGRVAEDFKLATGTWASVGPLRAKLIAAASPHVQDVVLAGINRDWIGALVFPNIDACRELCQDLPRDAHAGDVVAHPAVRARFQEVLDRLAARATGSANRIVRAILMEVPPSIDVGEVTDKGSINQRAVIAHRAALADELYEEPPSPRVIAARWS